MIVVCHLKLFVWIFNRARLFWICMLLHSLGNDNNIIGIFFPVEKYK